MNMPPHIVSDTFVNIVIDSKSYTINSDHPNFERVRDAIKDKDWDGIIPLIDVAKSIVEYSAGKVAVVDGVVFYNDLPQHNVITDKIINMMKEGFDVQPLCAFLNNLMKNPSSRAVTELYGFLETTNLPITEDGHFLAYKSVKADYTDGYTGTVDNSIGCKPTMERNQVDDDKDRTCSNGYHFCSLEYVRDAGWGGSGRHIMIIQINPADVVAIPSDYNNSKGRCCGYEVIGEHQGEVIADIFDKEVYTKEDMTNEFGYIDAGGAKAYEGEAYEGEDEPVDECIDCTYPVDDCGCKECSICQANENASAGIECDCETCFRCDEKRDDCACERCGDCDDHVEECVCEKEED